MIRFCMHETGNVWVGDTCFFFIFKQNKNILHMKKNPRGKKVWARNIFSFLK